MHTSASKCSQGQPTSEVVDSGAQGFNVPLGHGLYLFVEGSSGAYYLQVLAGAPDPDGHPVVGLNGVAESAMWVDIHQGRATLWVGHVTIAMPWASLLQVAEFFQLEIPQQVLEAGQELPQ